MSKQQVKSKQRVLDHGEVLTSEREVNAMLDLVHDETERFDSRFLEPACGDGNFLVAVLDRRLAKVDKEYRRSQHDWEIKAALSIACLYGVDILEDNVEACRVRLFDHFDRVYRKRFKAKTRDDIRASIRFILERNIVWGDALTMKRVDDESEPIVFSEWVNVGGSNFQRRDFSFASVLSHEMQYALPIFADLAVEDRTLAPIRVFPVTPLTWLPCPDRPRNPARALQQPLPGFELITSGQ
jgi:hypothetical protein